ncbi:MAG TPA: peptidoglycan recognition family protein [Bryobacteraceae bacterium]|jgi:hypothetical protein
MYKQWIGCSSGNFQIGRAGLRPEAVVVHRTGGSLADIDARFLKAGTFSSAHYAIGIDGSVHQYVEEADTAFHAGIVVNPTWTLIKTGKNPNLYTIGIELEGSAGEPVPEAQCRSAAGLIAEIAGRWQIAVDAHHLILHDEIRAGRNCPGAGFDREALLRNLPAPQTATPKTVVERQVRILRNTNVREGGPSTNARIVRVAPGNSTETVSGFTDQGERVQGNSYWYRTQDGNYLWAGATDSPNPVQPEQPQPIPLPTAAGAASNTGVPCGIPRIDQLMAGQLMSGDPAPPLQPFVQDPLAHGAVQDLLTGLGFTGLPTPLSSAYGVCGPRTTAALASFRQQQGLPQSEDIDSTVLRKMVSVPASDPRASTVYLSLVLGFTPNGMQKILSLVSQMEGAGKFSALNRNTDRAGLSFGLIQWAQRPGRLAGLLAAMSEADRAAFVNTFGAGDGDVADALLAHCRKPSGGVDPKTGQTVNPSFDLVAEPWISRFRQAALTARFQQIQVTEALVAFQASYDSLRRYAPDIRSERGVAFMIDVANQFGDAGAARLYSSVHRSGMNETEILEAVADASVEEVGDAFQTGVRARRDHFLNSNLLSSAIAFSEAQAAGAGAGG